MSLWLAVLFCTIEGVPNRKFRIFKKKASIILKIPAAVYIERLRNTGIDMSRGFVREGDQEEPPMIPPRAALPEGVTNYVTPNGMDQLVQERETLQTEIKELTITDERERRRTLAVIEGKLKLLNERIHSARVLDPKDQAKDEVRFGATVSLQNKSNNTKQQFTIVGVDEADVTKSKIAFVAPIARAVTGANKGEEVDFKLGNEIRVLKILDIQYQ